MVINITIPARLHIQSSLLTLLLDNSGQLQYIHLCISHWFKNGNRFTNHFTFMLKTKAKTIFKKITSYILIFLIVLISKFYTMINILLINLRAFKIYWMTFLPHIINILIKAKLMWSVCCVHAILVAAVQFYLQLIRGIAISRLCLN